MAHEKSVRDLMIPISEYTTVGADDLVKDAVTVLAEGLNKPDCHRAVLVVDAHGDPVGLLTIRSLIKTVEPEIVDLPHSITWII